MVKKLQAYALGLILSAGAVGHAQYAEINPVIDASQTTTSSNATTALFDLLFNYEIGNEIGNNGNAGVIYINGEIWVSAWASNEIRILSPDGIYLESMSIPGVTGIRSFTSDGTLVYAGDASNVIYEIDPVYRSLENTILAMVTTTAKSRMTAYDPTLDNGNGGFWLSDFNSDFSAVDMDGDELRVIPMSVHGASGVYGGAVDTVSVGGPYLWTFEQRGNEDALIRQLMLVDGTPTGVEYNYNTSGHQPSGNTSIAGGLFISPDIVPGKVTMMGIGQGTPTDQLFGLELMDLPLNVDQNKLTSFSLYPNPATDFVNIETTVSGDKAIVVYDMLGKQVINTVISGNRLDISGLKSGVYMVSISQNDNTLTKKLIVK